VGRPSSEPPLDLRIGERRVDLGYCHCARARSTIPFRSSNGSSGRSADCAAGIGLASGKTPPE
jgi:hypothetical protein